MNNISCDSKLYHLKIDQSLKLQSRWVWIESQTKLKIEVLEFFFPDLFMFISGCQLLLIIKNKEILEKERIAILHEVEE